MDVLLCLKWASMTVCIYEFGSLQPPRASIVSTEFVMNYEGEKYVVQRQGCDEVA